jgi:endonuclease YncB( thermonuclease family)
MRRLIPILVVCSLVRVDLHPHELNLSSATSASYGTWTIKKCDSGCIEGQSIAATLKAENDLWAQQTRKRTQVTIRPLAQYSLRRVRRVVDGDTLELIGGEKVRLIGVDTPETVDPRRPVQYFGKEASNFTRRLVDGKQVRLEYDQTRKDRYGRTLAYVFLENGLFLNAELIKQGYGFAYTRFPFKYLDDFRRYEHDARVAGLGLWKAK